MNENIEKPHNQAEELSKLGSAVQGPEDQGIVPETKPDVESESEPKLSNIEAAKKIAEKNILGLFEKLKEVAPAPVVASLVLATLSVGLAASGNVIGEKLVYWSTEFASENESVIQGFLNMMQSVEGAMDDPNFEGQVRGQLGFFKYLSIPLFLTTIGGSVASGMGSIKKAIEAFRPLMKKETNE